MGEARQRRLAREAGRPWKQDAPPEPKRVPWYLAESPGGLEVFPSRVAEPAASLERLAPVVAAPDDPSAADAFRSVRSVRLSDDTRVLVVDELPYTRRPRSSPFGMRGRELALLLAALGPGFPIDTLLKHPKP